MKSKKIMAVVGASAMLLALTACSSGTAPISNLNKVPLELAPVVSLKDTNYVGWGGSESFNPLVVVTNDYISMKNEADTCIFDIESAYQDSWKQSRGESFNSLDTLFSEMGTAVTTAEDTRFERIEGVDYAISNYAGSEKKHSRSAVRVFDDALLLPGFENDKISNEYGEGAEKGLPYISMTLSCDEQADIMELWDSALNTIQVHTDKATIEAAIEANKDISDEFPEIKPTIPDGVRDGYPDAGTPEGIGEEPVLNPDAEVTDPNDPAYKGEPIEDDPTIGLGTEP